MANQQDGEKLSEKRFDDHSVIVPPHRLKHVVTHAQGPTTIDMTAVARAEAALAELKDEFSIWMKDECQRLDTARRAIHDKGLDRATVERLVLPAHDIKGGATTLGYPLAERIATSLCRLLHHAPEASRIPMALIDHHVDTIKAIVRDEVVSPVNPYGMEIAEQLSILVEKYLAEELKDGYAEIAGDAAPRLRIKTNA
ncbi:MAG TPA: Hpt domain-containing protein [Xanthobacteraceae bacterium]|nr:Hpt domain-containing protein [Xanthobacteraceae bacterium]